MCLRCGREFGYASNAIRHVRSNAARPNCSSRQEDLPLVRLSAFQHLRPRKGKRGATTSEAAVTEVEVGGEEEEEGEERGNEVRDRCSHG